MEKLIDAMSLMPSIIKLSKDTFLQVTDAISATETKEELRLIVGGLLTASANVRNVVLQALEPFDLEGLECPEILFLALHDTDERNVELAMTLYQANSITLDETGLSRLFLLLGNLFLSIRAKCRTQNFVCARGRSESFSYCATF